MSDDPSNGYEAVAEEYIRRRGASDSGVAVVRDWSRLLPLGGSVLDLGCGAGQPIARLLCDLGFEVSGIDASPTLIEACRRNVPDADVVCEAFADSNFFNRPFDGIVMVGVIFLLSVDEQPVVLQQAASALAPGGRLLFSAPVPVCSWTDLLTDRRSRSLGADSYVAILNEAGLELEKEYDDEGDNHYYAALRP